MYKAVYLITSLFFLAFVSGCGSFSKSCSDGVCKYVEDGVVRYEGSSEKIEAIRKAEEKGYAEWLQFHEELARAPRKTKGEEIRIVVLTGDVSPDLKQHLSSYRAMLETRIKRDPRLVFVSEEQVKKNIEAKRPKNHKAKGFSIENLATDILGFNGGADVVASVEYSLTETMRKDGSQSDSPAFTVDMTSVYQFKTYSKSYTGRSMTFTIKDKKRTPVGKRNLKRDQAALSRLVRYISRRAHRLRSTMPTVAALEAIHSERRLAQVQPQKVVVASAGEETPQKEKDETGAVQALKALPKP